MGLRSIAEQDLAVVLEDATTGFGWAITLTDPAGASKALVGHSSDISQVIDPDTGAAISGRLASAVLRLSSISDADPGPALAIPVGIADTSQKPWLVQFDDINGNSYTFKVKTSDPDRALGVVVLILEFYKV